MKTKTPNYIRIICLLIIFAISVSHIPANIALAEDTIPEYEMIEIDGNKQVDFHNQVTTLPLQDALSLLGIDSVSDILARIIVDGTTIWETKGVSIGEDGVVNDLTLIEDATHTLQTGTLVRPSSWNPTTWYIEWTDSYAFTVKTFDVLTVNSNLTGLVSINNVPVDDTLSVKVYKNAKPTLNVSMGDLQNYAVTAVSDDNVLLNNAGSYTFENGLASDTVIDVVYVEDKESTFINGAITDHVSLDFEPTAQPNTQVTITATPDSGYYISDLSITVNGEKVPFVGAFSNGTVSGSVEIGDTKQEYVVNCTAKPILVLKDYIIDYNEELPAANTIDAILNLIDVENSAELFQSLDGVTLSYNASNTSLSESWKSLDYVPEGLDQIALHKFGALSTKETVKITYQGNGAQFTDGEMIFELSLVDNRKETAAIKVNENIEVVYGQFTKDDLMNALLKDQLGVYDSETNIKIEDSDIEFVIDPTILNVGTHELTLMFNGNAEYKACSGKATVIIKQAPVDLLVNSIQTKPSESVNMSDLIYVSNNDAGFATVIMGTDIVNEKTIVKLDLSHFVRSNELLQPVIDAVIGTQNNKTFTCAELKEFLITLQSVDETIQLDYLNKMIEILEKIESLDGVDPIEIILTTDDAVDTTNAGVYLVGALITDTNYEFDFDFGYLVVAPELIKLNVEFNQDFGKIISIDGINESLYDFGSHVVEEQYKDAESALNNIFFGLTVDKDIYLDNVAGKDIGAYTQISYIKDSGNVIYYAAPVIRSYVVTPEMVNIIFVDKEQNELTDFDFTYDGNEKYIGTIAKDKDGNILNNEKLTVKFYGAAFNGTPYSSDVAPTEAGLYTVFAMYKDEETELIGINSQSFVLKKAESGFDIKDVSATINNETHFVDIVNPNKMEYVSVTVNNKQLNVAFPSNWYNDTASITTDEIIAKLKEVFVESEIDSVLSENALDELKEIVNGIENYTININASNPSEVGEYKVFALALSSNYKTTFDSAVLTINDIPQVPDEPTVPTEPEDPEQEDTTTTPSEPENPVGPSNPSTPTEPTVPSEPTDTPTEPSNPQDPGAIETPKLGLENTSETAVWSLICFVSLVMLTVEFVLLKKKKH